MDIFNAFATDEKLEVEGRWVPLDDEASVRVARNGNPAYLKTVRKLLKERKIDLSNLNDSNESQADEVFAEGMAQHILVGWKNISFKGEPLVVSVENARKLLAVKDFRKKISALSDEFDGYRVAQEEAQKNVSATTSPGA